MILVKIWIHLSSEEQLKRFEARKENPLKSWKLTDEDWRNREKRDAYAEAVEDMLARTDEPNAPWSLIEGDSKRWARVAVIDTVIARIEEGMREWGMEPPDAAGCGRVDPLRADRSRSRRRPTRIGSPPWHRSPVCAPSSRPPRSR